MKRRFEWWHYVALAMLALQLLFFLVAQMRPGLLGLVCWIFGFDSLLWWAVAGLLMLAALIWCVWRRPFWSWWRMVGFAMILALACTPFAFRIYPSSYDDDASTIRFRVPFDGPTTVGWGGATPGVNYHVAYPSQRWAYDLLVTKDGNSHQGDATELANYYCYDIAVLAPADGLVRATYEDARDMPIGLLGGTPAGGNQVVIEVAPSQYLFLCHLKPGSIAVEAGDRVTQGQAVARVGNSGNTSEPHLHVHLQDTPMMDFGEGIPLHFHQYRAGGDIVERGIPTGGFRHGRLVGQIIEHVGDESAKPQDNATQDSAADDN